MKNSTKKTLKKIWRNVKPLLKDGYVIVRAVMKALAQRGRRAGLK